MCPYVPRFTYRTEVFQDAEFRKWSRRTKIVLTLWLLTIIPPMMLVVFGPNPHEPIDTPAEAALWLPFALLFVPVIVCSWITEVIGRRITIDLNERDRQAQAVTA